MKRTLIILVIFIFSISTVISQSSSVVLTITPNQSGANISWTTSSTGVSFAVFILKGSSGNPVVSNGNSYTASSVYGNGDKDDSEAWLCIYNGTGTSVDVTGLVPVTAYRVQVIEYTGSGGSQTYDITTGGDNPKNFNTSSLDPPDVALTQLTVESKSFSTATFTWGGTGNFVLFIRGTTDDVADPDVVDGTTYTPNSIYGNGSEIAVVSDSSWYCVYSSTGNTASVSNLRPNVDYKAVIYTFTGNGSARVYNTYDKNDAVLSPENEVTFITDELEAPTGQTSLSGIVRFVDRFQSFTVNQNNIVVFLSEQTTTGTYTPPVDKVDAYEVDGVFANGPSVTDGEGKVWYPVYQGPEEDFLVTNLTHTTDYRIAAYRYNTDGTVYKYNLTITASNVKTLTTGKPAPGTQSTLSINSEDINEHSATVSISGGTGESRVVFMKEGTSGSPGVTNGLWYFEDASFEEGFSSDDIWYPVYEGSLNSFIVSNLNSYTDFQLAVYEYNNYLQARLYNQSESTATFKTKTDGSPTQTASSLVLTPLATKMKMSFNPGDGYRVMVLVKQTSGSETIPTLPGSYTAANASFGTTSALVSDGWYVVYDGTHTNADSRFEVTDLEKETDYRVAIVTYNGSDSGPQYLLTGIPYASTTTYNKVLSGYSGTIENWDPSEPAADSSDNIAIAAGSYIGDNVAVHNLILIPYGSETEVTVGTNGRLYFAGTYNSNNIDLDVTSDGMIFNETADVEVNISFSFAGQTNQWLPFANPFSSSIYLLDDDGIDFYAKKFSESNAEWEYLENIRTSDGMILYSYENNIIYVTGTLKAASSKTKSVTFTSGDPYTGFNFIANPYLTALNWSLADDPDLWTRTNLETTYWLSTGGGNYGSFNSAGPDSTNDVSRFIPPLKSFWVQANSANPELVIRLNVRSTGPGSGGAKKKSVTTRSTPEIRILATSENGYYDEAVLGFHAEAGEGVDKYDTRKISGRFDAPQFFSYDNETWLSINKLPESKLNENRTVVPFGFYIGKPGEISLAIDADKLPADFEVFFNDKYTGERIQLFEGLNEISFQTNASEPYNRFEIVFQNIDQATEIFTGDKREKLTRIYSFNNEIFISADDAGPSNKVMIYDLAGKLQYMKDGLNNGVNTLRPGLDPGFYIVLVKTNLSRRSEKVLIK